MTAVLSQLTVNGDRLNKTILQLAEIGKLSEGCICRLAFTSEDRQARQVVQQWMREAGMTVRIDAAGNIIGRYPGLYEAAALATGSHIDTVPSGGPYDGVLGVLAGIEVVRVLKENNIRLSHPLEVIAFTDEESSMIGCRAMAGTVLRSPENYQPEGGLSIQTCLELVGGNWQRLPTAQRTRAEVAAFVELHVEQGAVLETYCKEIGVVQGVVGMQRYSVTILGRANHAGTTPMEMRQDALVAAAEIILFVKNLALSLPTHPVATVGFINASPNAVNIVPGRVELSVDMRDLSPTHLNEMVQRLKHHLQRVATDTNTDISISPILCVEPTPAASHVQTTIERVCQRLNYSYCHLPSRAGHDALEIGRFTDMGMIFVPSQEGVSHSGDEYTSPEQCVQGATVLLHTLLELDQYYPV